MNLLIILVLIFCHHTFGYDTAAGELSNDYSFEFHLLKTYITLFRDVSQQLLLHRDDLFGKVAVSCEL